MTRTAPYRGPNKPRVCCLMPNEIPLVGDVDELEDDASTSSYYWEDRLPGWKWGMKLSEIAQGRPPTRLSKAEREARRAARWAANEELLRAQKRRRRLDQARDARQLRRYAERVARRATMHRYAHVAAVIAKAMRLERLDVLNFLRSGIEAERSKDPVLGLAARLLHQAGLGSSVPSVPAVSVIAVQVTEAIANRLVARHGMAVPGDIDGVHVRVGCVKHDPWDWHVIYERLP